MNLQENPFAVLGVSPRDNRHTLLEKADEAALLNGAAVEDALASLLKMNQRVEAELSWFPGTDPSAAETFLRYAKELSGGGRVPMPSLEGLGCPLAQANALSAFFAAWPDDYPEYTFGLCRSLDRILSQVTADETLSMINEDRQAGGWDPIQDELALADPLEARLRELVQVVRIRMDRAANEKNLLDTLNRIMSSDMDKQGTVAQAASDAYVFRIHDQEESLRTRINQQLSALLKDRITATRIAALKPNVESWCRLTGPLRQTAGAFRNHAESICHDLRECIVSCFNSAPTSTEKRSRILPVAGGTQTRTVTYESKKNACQQAIDFSKWLAALFPEQTRFVEMLKEDQKKLSGIITDEERMVESKLILGR